MSGLDLEDKYPLHNAAREGRLDNLRTLLASKKYDVNKGTFELVRPLHEACLAGHFDCALLLIEYGANVNLTNIDGATALCDACSSGDIQCVRLLLQHGALVNPPLLLTTPLHEAVFRDHCKCLVLLINCGANMNKSDCHYGTPLHIAACKGYKNSAAILLRSGACPNIPQIHQTPLHEAARSQDVEFLELLLAHGANVYACNSRGLTARQLVPSSTSSCKILLQEWEKMPRSLLHYCRLRIRTALGPHRLKFIPCLQIPNVLMKFVNFE
uniref:SOCS box domain-containing protein n=2 Tax=Arion vulgaris TaxID=1028688 RepID=A0A0B7AHT9_9EUPU